MFVSDAQAVFKPVFALHDAVLSSIIRPVGEPQTQQITAGCFHYLAALDNVRERLFLYCRRWMAQTAKLIHIILKNIWIDRANMHAERFSFMLECYPIAGLVPGDVQCYRRCNPGQLVNISSVG